MRERAGCFPKLLFIMARVGAPQRPLLGGSSRPSCPRVLPTLHLPGSIGHWLARRQKEGEQTPPVTCSGHFFLHPWVLSFFDAFVFSSLLSLLGEVQGLGLYLQWSPMSELSHGGVITHPNAPVVSIAFNASPKPCMYMAVCDLCKHLPSLPYLLVPCKQLY